MSPIGANEIGVAIQPTPAGASGEALVPAAVFKKLFDAVLAALIAADREIHAKTASSEFVIGRLSAAPCEFSFVEKAQASGAGAPSIALFRRCAGRVYRSDYRILLEHRRLMRAFQRIVAAVEAPYAAVVRYHDTELPLDEFFRRQVDRVGLENESGPPGERWYQGAVIGAFDGRLEAIDYRAAAWSGRLTLAGGEVEITCVFDKSRGENAYNPFGNKDVAVAGRAIYTGDSQLPERLEVMTIEELPRSTAAIDIRGALSPDAVGGWDDEFDHLHKQ